MSVLIGHASISEDGSINGVAGDQTGKEVCTRSWYSKSWNVMLICTDKELAKRAAQEMRYACENNKIGYGQSDRRTAYNSAVKNGGTFKNASGNTDCSQLVSGCYVLAGLTQLSPDCTTRNLKNALLNTGKFKAYTDAAHLNSDAYAEVGAVYLKEGSHVVMALENGAKAGSSGSSSGSTSGGSSSGGSYYPAFSSQSIIDGLKSIGVDSSMENRKKIAEANGISNYSGQYDQNTKLLSLAKQGKLKKSGSTSSTSSSAGSSSSGSSSGGSGSSGVSGYIVGRTYTLQANMSVRTGPGTSYRRKSHSELTADGQAHDRDKNGCLDSGTVVTCQEVRQNGSQTWIKVPSGWMCARDGNTVYIS